MIDSSKNKIVSCEIEGVCLLLKGTDISGSISEPSMYSQTFSYKYYNRGTSL